MPDTPALQNHFGQPGAQKKGCGFPTATLLVLCNKAGLIARAIALPLRTHEASQISQLHRHLQPGDLLVYDRAGCSFTHLAQLFQAKFHGILRMHQRQIVSFRCGRRHAGQYPKGQQKGKPKSQWLARLGHWDQLVRWYKPAQRPQWLSAAEYEALPAELTVRELRFQVCRRGCRTRMITLVTTLVDSQTYSAQELAQQYLERWEIEVDFRHIKQTMKMDVLKCKSVDGVLKELAMFVLIYNLVRMVMLQASRRQQVHLRRISFIDALRCLSRTGALAQTITLLTNPERPGRFEPRAVKRRPKKYSLLTKPRKTMRQLLVKKGVAA